MLENMERTGVWAIQAGTTMFLSIPKNVAKRRSFPHGVDGVSGWDARGDGMEKEPYNHAGAASSHVGGTEVAAWDALLEMVNFNTRARCNDKGPISSVVDIVKTFGKV